jgi:hypothetical protein
MRNVIALLLAASVACGSGSGPSQPTPAPGGSTPSNPSAPAGGSPTGGGGSPAPTGGGGSPAPTGGGTPGGATSPCDGLLAQAGAPVEVHLDTGTHAACALATTNPDGQVVLGVRLAGNAATHSMTLFSSDGAPQGGPMFLEDLLPGAATQDIDPWFHWTSSGYQGLVHETGVVPALFLRTWDAHGTIVRSGSNWAGWSAPDGNGGTVLASVAPNASALQWVDASGAVTRSVPLDASPGIVAVAWGTGHVLAIVTGGSARARWFDGAGAPLTPWFDVGTSATGTSVHLLIDGRVALSDGGTWNVVLADGVDHSDAVPAWLGTRPGTRLATIRGARGYAVLPLEGHGDPTRVEILTPAGDSCGTVALPPAAALPPGVDATPTRLDVGQDGTVLQTVMLGGTGSVALGSGVHCEFRWWPGLLR